MSESSNVLAFAIGGAAALCLPYDIAARQWHFVGRDAFFLALAVLYAVAWWRERRRRR